MGFFDDIGRAFQDFGNQVNNEVIKPAGTELSKAQDLPKIIEDLPKQIEKSINSELKKVDPKLSLKDIPNEIISLPNKIETQINNDLKKINPRLKLPPKLPPPRILKPTEINDIIKKGFEDTISKPFEKDIIKPFEKDIIKPSQKISNDIKTGFQKDIISPSKTLFDTIGDGLKQGGSTKSSNNDSGSSYDLIIYAGLGLLAAYIIIK